MAVKVEFEGYIKEVKPFDWGTVYTVAHRQVTKNAAGQWETAGYDYFEVSAEPGFEEDAKVKVVGNLKTKRFDKRDGSKGVALQVRADSIEPVQKPATMPEMQAALPGIREIPEETPF